MPARLTVPWVGLNAVAPQNAAGRINEPAVWLPNAIGTICAATAAAEPRDRACVLGKRDQDRFFIPPALRDLTFDRRQITPEVNFVKAGLFLTLPSIRRENTETMPEPPHRLRDFGDGSLRDSPGRVE